MPLVRSRGEEIVAVWAGRRLRVRSEWIGISEDAYRKLKAIAGDLLEVKGREAEQVPRVEELDSQTASTPELTVASEPNRESEAEPPEEKPSGSRSTRRKKASEEE